MTARVAQDCQVLRVSQDHSISDHVSLLDVPFRPFPPISLKNGTLMNDKTKSGGTKGIFCTQTLGENPGFLWARTHPSFRAAIAVRTFRGNAILLIVIHLSLSTPLMTRPHTLCPLSLQLPCQNPLTTFHVSALLLLLITTVVCPSAPTLAE